MTDLPVGRIMDTDPFGDLYRVLLDAAEKCPLPVVAQCAELLTTVLARRLHDEMGEIVLP